MNEKKSITSDELVMFFIYKDYGVKSPDIKYDTSICIILVIEFVIQNIVYSQHALAWMKYVVVHKTPKYGV
jgi:hypothetical protein